MKNCQDDIYKFFRWSRRCGLNSPIKLFEKKKLIFFLILKINLFINLACLFVCLFVSNNLKTAEPIGSNFFVGSRLVYRWSKFQNVASIKIRLSSNFVNPRFLFIKSGNFLCFCSQRENMFTIEIDNECKAPWNVSAI